MSAELSADNLSSLMAERLTEEQTSVLMEQFAEVMRKCEEDGINRDEELKQSEFSTCLSFLWVALSQQDVAHSRRRTEVLFFIVSVSFRSGRSSHLPNRRRWSNLRCWTLCFLVRAGPGSSFRRRGKQEVENGAWTIDI